MALQSINLTCTNCFGKLDYVGDGRLQCPYCGSSFFNKDMIGVSSEYVPGSARSKSENEVISIITKAVKSYNDQDGWGVQISTDGKPLSKDKKARDRFNIPDSETIYMIYDETMFGSCKEGYAITGRGLRLSYNEFSPQLFPWSEFADVEMKKKDSFDIKLNDIQFTLTGNNGRDNTFEMLEKIQKGLRR